MRNGPAHVFGDHTACSESFCKYVEHEVQEDTDVEEDTTPLISTEQLLPGTLADCVSFIVAEETDDEPTFEEHAQDIVSLSQAFLTGCTAMSWRVEIA